MRLHFKTRLHLAQSLLLLTLVAPTVDAARVPGLPRFQTDETQMVQVIVLLEEALARTALRDFQGLDVVIRRQFDLIPAVSIRMPAVALAALRQQPGVLAIYEDAEVHASLSVSGPLVGSTAVHQSGATGVGARVCIIDTGVDDTHPSLAPLAAEYDFVSDDYDATDDNGHGTHVAGIIASRHVSDKGVAPGASLLAAKVLSRNGTGYTSDVIAALEWCRDQGAQVINMSLGGGTFSEACDSEPLAAASNAVVDDGVTVVVAAGNDGRPDRISSPACASKVIAVGAVDKLDQHASYSNGGPLLDITAPGTSIRSTYPGGGFANLTGTSMATPHVAGAAALLLSSRPMLKPNEVETVLKASARDLGAAGFDPVFGHGRLDVSAAFQVALLEPAEPGPAPEVLWNDDFGSLMQWTQTAAWEARKPAERAVPNQAGGNTVAHASRCSAKEGCTLKTAEPIDLSEFQNVELSFWRYIDRSIDQGEEMRLEIGTGLAWETIRLWGDAEGDDQWHNQTLTLPEQWLRSGVYLRLWTNVDSLTEEVEMDDLRLVGFRSTGGPPLANAGPDQTATDHNNDGTEVVSLSGISSSDDEVIVSYVWATASGITLGEGAEVAVPLALGSHTVTLTVTDDDGLQSSDETIVTIQPNIPPVALAGEDQAAVDDNHDNRVSFKLDGSASWDEDGTVVSYLWTYDQITLGSGTELSVTAAMGTHVLTLTVTDDGGATASDTAQLSASPIDPQPPVADAGEDQTVSDADGDGLESVELDGKASYDPEGTDLTFAWSTSGALLWTGATLQATMPVGVFQFDLEVTDGNGETDTDFMIVKVLANKPPQAIGGPDQSVLDQDESGAEFVTLDAGASSDPDGSIVKYQWYLAGQLLGTGSNLRTELPLGTHEITLHVTDNGGAVAEDSVMMTVSALPAGPKPLQELFRENFESDSLTKWTQVGSTIWRVQTPKEQGVPGGAIRNQVAHGERCNETCTLTLAKAIDLTPYASAWLHFWRFADKSFDTGEFLRLDLFDGSSWQAVRTWVKSAGADDTWQAETIDLTPYLQSLFQLRFVTLSSSSIEEAEVDDVVIEAQAK